MPKRFANEVRLCQPDGEITAFVPKAEAERLFATGDYQAGGSRRILSTLVRRHIDERELSDPRALQPTGSRRTVYRLMFTSGARLWQHRTQPTRWGATI